MKQVLIAAIAISALFYVSLGMAGSTMTNADVIKLVKAGMSSDIVLAAIRGTDATAFDTSANNLIMLKAAGASDAVIQAMIAPPSAATSESMPKPDVLNPEEVIAINDGVKTPMRYLVVNARSKFRGFGRWAQYAVLRRYTAGLRLGNQPFFLIAIPNNAQMESYLTLVKLAQRKRKNTREILIVSDLYGNSLGGFPQDRVIAVVAKAADDQSKAPQGFTVYTVSPSSPLSKGEYAVVVSSGQTIGYEFFVSAGNAGVFFDFGVD